MSSQNRSSGESSNTDDEYCIVDEQEQDDDLAEPVVRWFNGGPPPMIDNHFSVPAARADVLKAPKSFPAPITRFAFHLRIRNTYGSLTRNKSLTKSVTTLK
jgi:hypothetical protein